MFTWQLWKALHTDQPRHPMFRFDRPKFSDPPPLLTKLLTDILPFGMLALMVFSAWLLAIAFIVGLVFLLVLSPFIYGAIAAYGVSRDMAKYRANGRYDLVALTPQGIFGATWAIGANFLQKTDSLGYLRWAMNRLYLITGGMFLLGLLFSIVLFNNGMTQVEDNPFQTYLLPGVVNGLLLLVMHFLDFTRAGLVGTLIGWIAPTYASTRQEAHLLALALYLILQIFTYIGFSIVIWQGCEWVLSSAGLTSSVLLNGVRLLLIVSVREATLRGLWAMLLWRLNVLPSETQNEVFGGISQ